MFWKITGGLEEGGRKDNEYRLTLTMDWFADRICNRKVKESAADDCYGKDQQWHSKFIKQNQRIAPHRLPSPHNVLHSREYTSMSRRIDIRRTLSPTRDVTLSTTTLISAAGR